MKNQILDLDVILLPFARQNHLKQFEGIDVKMCGGMSLVSSPWDLVTPLKVPTETFREISDISLMLF